MENNDSEGLRCRFYENKYPEIDDLVMVNVGSIQEMGAYVTLLEYDNIEGMILLSELSRRRIRSINKLIRVGKNEVVMVLRVDKEKGYIDLSKRRVDPEDILKCEERFSKAKSVHGVLRQVAQQMKVNVKVLYESVAWPLSKKYPLVNNYTNEEEKKKEYMNCYDVFKMGITDSTVFDELKIDEETKSQLVVHIKKRLTPQPIKIRSDIEVTCFTYEGIEAIRHALRMAQNVTLEDVKSEMEVKVKLIAPPMYVMTTNTLDKHKGIELLKNAIQVIKVEIEKKGGAMNVKMEPKVVSLHEERELNLMMERLVYFIFYLCNALFVYRLELENRQVDGDDDNDE